MRRTELPESIPVARPAPDRGREAVRAHAQELRRRSRELRAKAEHVSAIHPPHAPSAPFSPSAAVESHAGTSRRESR